MKAFILLSFLVGASAPALAAKNILRCHGTSDPDFANAQIYQEGEKFIVEIDQESGDGDNFDSDTIEMRRVDDGSDSMLTLKQVENSYPTPPEESESPRRVTRRATLRVPFLGGEGKLLAAFGPNGDRLVEDLECKIPKKK